ncbi:MAG: hypothetical protein QXR58_01650 [Candidatus Micrarchaeaceae archaeon]
MSDFEELRKKMIENAKKGITESYASEEYALMQAIAAYLQLSKSYNLLSERLSEWFGLYVPELKVQSQKQLIELSTAFAEGKVDNESIASILGSESNYRDVVKKINSTIGRKSKEEEKKVFAEFARLGRMTSAVLDSLEGYITAAANRIMPNVTYLTDAKIAAELLSKAGSLERLALMPAGTIQVLGAEKALFKHIKFGSKPPKYGILFKLPKISSGRRDIRGKIARLYATKISIAVKADYFSKHFIAKELKASLDDSIKRIESEPEKKRTEGTRRERNGRRRYSSGRHKRSNYINLASGKSP